MSGVGAPRHDPVPIGKIAEPPFVRLPDATTLFATRAGRLRALSEGHPLAPYLSFLASLSHVQHRLVAAALQVDFARLAARLEAQRLVPVGDGACPACGAPPVSSMVVGWPGAETTRFCPCSLCGTLWNYVRVKCTLCGSTKGITYRQVEGGDGLVRAETCDNCRGYVKILQQQQDPALDPVADDVASLALDLLVRELGYRCGAVNPFMWGH